MYWMHFHNIIPMTFEYRNHQGSTFPCSSICHTDSTALYTVILKDIPAASPIITPTQGSDIWLGPLNIGQEPRWRHPIYVWMERSRVWKILSKFPILALLYMFILLLSSPSSSIVDYSASESFSAPSMSVVCLFFLTFLLAATSA